MRPIWGANPKRKIHLMMKHPSSHEDSGLVQILPKDRKRPHRTCDNMLEVIKAGCVEDTRDCPSRCHYAICIG